MTDLLRLFEEAKASQGKLNLAVRFNFDKDLRPLEFDFEHFRRWQETWQRIAGTFLATPWNHDSLWQLSSLLRSMDARVHDLQMQQWLAMYYKGENLRGHWSDTEPAAPQSGVAQLDATLKRVWRVWLTVVYQSKRYGSDRTELHDRWYSEARDEHAETEREALQERWPLRLLAGLDSDHWAGSLAQGTYAKAEAIRELSEPERSNEANALNRKLTELFDSLGSIEFQGELLQRTLQDFLSLPVWQRRHELYSAWISTQILNALRDQGVEIHSFGGQLLFEFKGTHLATIGTFHPNLHLMAELRSPLAAPRGMGRKRAMQPDYSLITSPITSPEGSILEVECKQYLVASKRKFADALTDYATGRPNAQILLVNYGEASTDILDEVDAAVRSRTHIIGLMRPRSKRSQSRFAELVEAAVSNRFALAERTDSDPARLQTPSGTLAGQIVLIWGGLPKDLDLHLRILQGEQHFDLNFSNMGSSSDNPWAQLNQDIRDGHGDETIRIFRWVDGLCGATLTIFFGKQQLVFECPTSGAGVWWDVFLYSPATGKLEVFNRITDSF
jgi:hypothetical protein